MICHSIPPLSTSVAFHSVDAGTVSAEAATGCGVTDAVGAGAETTGAAATVNVTVTTDPLIHEFGAYERRKRSVYVPGVFGAVTENVALAIAPGATFASLITAGMSSFSHDAWPKTEE